MRAARLPIILLIVALAAVSGSQAWLETRADPPETAARLLYVPNGRFLEVASLGHATFVADLIYLWSIQHYSTYTSDADRFGFLEHLYSKVIARLDPQFVDPYLVGALLLAIEGHDLEGAFRLLDQGMAANPDAWLLPYEAGFWAYDMAHQYDRAAAYFDRAMAIPGAPVHTRRLHAEMFNKRGDKATSLRLWTAVLDDAGDDERVRAIAANHVHDLSIDLHVQQFTAAIESYVSRHGRRPVRLEALVDDGLLAALPVDPDGRRYDYDVSTGAITSSTPFRLRRR